VTVADDRGMNCDPLSRWSATTFVSSGFISNSLIGTDSQLSRRVNGVASHDAYKKENSSMKIDLSMGWRRVLWDRWLDNLPRWRSEGDDSWTQGS
jgi:hypothetical protein